MAPPRRNLLPKDRFGLAFGGLKTQNYHDPAARGPGSHTIRTIAWNPTGQLIATGSADRTLRIWNPERSQVKYSTELRGHTAGIEKVVFNPVRDSELASCSTDGTVRVWDVRSKTCVSRLDVGGEAFTLSWSADGRVMVVGRKVSETPTSTKPVRSAPGTSQLTKCPPSAGRHPHTHLRRIPIHPNHPPRRTTQRRRSATATATKAHFYTINLHSPRTTPQPIQTNATTFSHHISTPSSPDLHLFATTGEGTVKIISYPSFDVLHTLHAHTSACLSISLAPTGRYLAVGGSDALISLWDTTDWICKRTVSSNNGGAVRGVSWSFDGRFICGACDEVGCGGNGLEIFHAETGESVHTVPTGGNANSGIPAVAWHPSRYWLAYSTTADGSGPGGLRIVGAAGGNL
ncbi:WD40 repeat-like protein [Aspergillus eucalypticola CBS 122712]|uniref:WD40 repeat-like protein n=1 Tax=Aspergillus eucalypticola (strain CBS 122712 / IBT 29274) TaxID=1448314 RepID=A0A317VVI3_ASPEC|nr:WD40 repeat-like protein [Aspergillus eucalypticola CBS 122712]PWY76878.1 WD40 repeat-like protein [Aspergillus eucalypticola CBS 122712]